MIERLRRFIEGDRREGFGSLALELFAHHVARNPDYASFCGGLQPARWQDIPAVPVALFRDLPLASFPVEQAGVVRRVQPRLASVPVGRAEREYLAR